MAMRILGHRGASADHPENTLAAFAGAMAQGADGVELDVMRCRTGELVVCHDDWLDRLTGLHLELRSASWSTLRRLDVGSRLGFAPATLPRLEEVFEALPIDAVVNVELKSGHGDDARALSVEVGRLLSQRQLLERTFVSSFDPVCLLHLAQAFPAVRRGLLLDPGKAWFPQAWLWLPVVASMSVHPHFARCTPERVGRWQRVGLQVVAWTVDDLDEARRLRALGVDWLITNRPGALRRELSHVPEPRPSAPGLRPSLRLEER
jgi:glycerophosphoryl diester phosphodiesterase